LGIPGIGDEIDGAMQQAPQPTRHSIGSTPLPVTYNPRRTEGASKPQIVIVSSALRGDTGKIVEGDL
jgi:hypothetical protein